MPKYLGSIALGAFGALLLFRGLVRANRALVAEGTVEFCGGSAVGSCDPYMVLGVAKGTAVFAAAYSKVVAVYDDGVDLLVQDEPVLLRYRQLRPKVSKGQYMGVGQEIGVANGQRLSFAAFQVVSVPVELRPMPPGAWLAARGLQPATTLLNKPTCAGRNIVVTAAERAGCDFVRPDQTGFAMLPVTIDFQ
jgi:hypothetical protein